MELNEFTNIYDFLSSMTAEQPFSLVLYLSHAQTLCEHPKFWRVRALLHARVVAPCVYTPLDGDSQIF